MARPKKEKELRHKHQIMLRLTESVSRIYELKYEVLKMAGDFHSVAEWHKGIPGRCFHGNTETHSE